MKIKVNIHEIARRAGVSTATVSRTLNGNGSVREATRQKVISIANEFNYKPNPMARGLSSQKSDTIGLILPELVGEFFMDIIHSVDEAAYEAKHYVMVSSSHSQRNVVETLVEFMSSGRVDGVILMAPQMHKEMQTILAKNNRPIVLINASKNLPDAISFNFDNYQGAYAATEHLIGHGYQRIGMIKGPEGNSDAEERFEGFMDALKENSLPYRPELVIPGDFTIKSGYYGFMRLMSLAHKPEAIFAANDMIALGCYEAAKKSNILIPQDVAIAGFDDIYPGSLVTPRLTTVHVPLMEMCREAVRYLLKITSGEIPANKPYRKRLSTGLIIGGSCGCTPADSLTI